MSNIPNPIISSLPPTKTCLKSLSIDTNKFVMDDTHSDVDDDDYDQLHRWPTISEVQN